MPDTIKDSTHQRTSHHTDLSTNRYSQLSTNRNNSLTSEDYNLCNLIRSVLGDYDLTPGAIRTLIFLIVSSGKKGFTYLLVNTIAQRTRSCRTQTKQYIRELEQKQRIRVIRRPGRSSVYQIVGIYGKSSEVGRKTDHIKKYISKKTTVTASPNVLSVFVQEEQQPDETQTSHVDNNGKIYSPDPDENLPEIPELEVGKKIVRFNLVKEILDLTHDHKSRAFWIKLVKNVDPETVCYLISSLRLAMNSGQVDSPGRYLVGICKRVCPWVFEIQSKKQATRQAQQPKDGLMSGKTRQSEPEQQPDFETGLEAIRRIQALLGKKVA